MGINGNTSLPPFDDVILQDKELLRLVFEVTQDCIWDWDLRTGLANLSSRYYEVTGYRPEEVTPNLAFWQSLIHPDDLPRVMAVMEAHLRGETPESCFDFRLITKDGTVTRFTGKGRVVEHDAAGQPVRMVGVIRDITESKQAPQHSAEYLEAIMQIHKLSGLFLREGNLEPVLAEIVTVAIAISGADFGNIQILDPATGCLRIVAQRGFPAWWCEYWDYVAKGQGVCGTALEQGERIVVEDVETSPIFLGTPALEIQRRAGVRAVQSTPLLSSSGKLVGMFSTHYREPQQPEQHALLLLDMLARQAADTISYALAENALRESEAHYRAVVEDQTEVIIRFLPDGTFTFVNEAFCRLFGKTPEELVGSIWQSVVVAEDVPLIEERLGTMTAANPVVVIENRVYDASGNIRWMQFVNHGFFGDDGSLLEMQAVGRDITERVQMESALRRSHEELELRVSERTEELVASHKILISQKEALEQKNIALREVLEQLEIEKSHLKKNIVDNLDHVVKPLLTQIRPDRISDQQIEALEQGLEDLVSTFGRKISDRKFRLTPKEVQLCNYIRNGLANKEIARVMNLSVMTVSKHRENIRKKLEIRNKSINLSTFLQNL